MVGNGDFSKIKMEDIGSREDAINALSRITENTYRRMKGKVLSVFESIGLDEEAAATNKKALIGHIKTICNFQAETINEIIKKI